MCGDGVRKRGKEGWGRFGGFILLHFPQSSFYHLTSVFIFVCLPSPH